MIEMWQHALDAVRRGDRAVLVMVVDHEGSVPGTTGAALVVSDTGVVGTVGGGVAEHEIIGQAQAFSGPPEMVDVEHTPEASGSLCSGRHTMVIMALQPGSLPAIEAIVETLSKHRAGVLLLSHEGINFTPGSSGPTTFSTDSDGWRFAITIGLIHTLTIVGGGHCAFALSRVMATLPFKIIVFDDRADLPTMAANSFAHRLDVVPYADLAEHIDQGDRSWVVVMTYGHANDEEALRALVGLKLRYLGLLGSASKVQRLFGRMRSDGVPRTFLDSISAPVGLSIGSHTPEEIAISIAAEIIREMHQVKGPGVGD